MEENFPNPHKRMKREFGETFKLDFIVQLYERGMIDVIENILINLDYLSLTRVENVSKSWSKIISSSRIWEMFVKTKLITGHPLFKRIYNLLKIDEVVSPEKCLWFSFRQMPEAISICCRKLESNWRTTHNVFARVLECGVLDNELSSSTTHWQLDDSFIALKNETGLLKIWSRKTYELENVFQTHYGNGDGTCKNPYVIGDDLFLSLKPDGVIQVWDLMTNEITYELKDLKGSKILSLYFNPEDEILVSCSIMSEHGNSKCGSLVTVWEQLKKKRGQFSLKSQQKLPGVDVLQILGWDSETVGLLCKIPRDRDLHVVQIYSHRGPLKLKSEIQLEDNYRLDWTDGFLVIACHRTIKLYNSSSGLCIRTINDTPMNFSDRFSHVSVCSIAIVACCTVNEDDDDERTDLHVFQMENVLDPDWIPHRISSYLLTVPFPMEKLKINELQIVGAMLDVDSVLFQIVEFYPACAHCGLYKLGMGETFLGSRRVLRCEDCLVEQYCSTLCLQSHFNHHKTNDCDHSNVVEVL